MPAAVRRGSSCFSAMARAKTSAGWRRFLFLLMRGFGADEWVAALAAFFHRQTVRTVILNMPARSRFDRPLL